MARTITLALIRTNALRRADMENVDTFVGSALGEEMDQYVNESISELYDLIIDSSAQEWYLRQDTTGVTVSGTKQYALPSDMYLLKGVDMFIGTQRYTLTPYSFAERNAYEGTPREYPRSYRGRPRHYRLEGALTDSTGVHQHNIRLTPEPDGAYEFDIWYYPHAPVLDADTDVWDGFNGWEEYVIVDVALKLLAKEQNGDAFAMLAARKAELKERIINMAPHHDHGHGECLQDVMGDYSDGTNWYL